MFKQTNVHHSNMTAINDTNIKFVTTSATMVRHTMRRSSWNHVVSFYHIEILLFYLSSLIIFYIVFVMLVSSLIIFYIVFYDHSFSFFNIEIYRCQAIIIGSLNNFTMEIIA